MHFIYLLVFKFWEENWFSVHHICDTVSYVSQSRTTWSYQKGWEKSERKNGIKNIHHIGFWISRDMCKIRFQVEMEKQHIPQLIAVPPGSRSECVLCVQWEYWTQHVCTKFDAIINTYSKSFCKSLIINNNYW